MSDGIKAMLASVITVATVTLFVLPRRGAPVPKTITTINTYMVQSVRAMLGTRIGE